MSTENNPARGNFPISIITLLLVIFIVWIFADGRPFFRHSGRDLKTTVQDTAHDIRSTGRDVADSIRHEVQ